MQSPFRDASARFRKARGRGLAELRERAAQALAAELEHRRFGTRGREPSDAWLWRSLTGSVRHAVGHDPARLHEHFVRRNAPRFLVGVVEGDATAALLAKRLPEAVKNTIRAADDVLAGRFNILGYRRLSFGAPINWHLDPLRGIQSPRVHWSRISYLDPLVVGDHKVVWELNRHQHLVVLGRAYRLTHREAYAQEFVKHVNSWMDENPPKQGVNWASSLEIAYRLIAWLWALELFRYSPSLHAGLRLRMLKYLHVHATHLEQYLSTYFSPNTHLTGEALGLWYAGMLLPEFRRAKRWKALGWSILVGQIDRQVLADGVYFEQATHYHRYTADIYLHAVLLAQANGHPAPQQLLARLNALVDHLANISRPDGSIPIVGDDDGGKVVALEERRCNDARSVFAVAAVVFRDPRYRYVAGGVTEELAWLCGPEGVATYDALDSSPPTSGSREFARGGIVVMRDGWAANSHQAVIDCGPHGSPSGGHSHADALSLELTAYGCPMIVDPGTYSYVDTADRDHFRGTSAHNTVTVDGASSSAPAGPFSWTTRADGRLETWWSSDEVDYFSGSHDGYGRLADPARHQRRILFVKRGFWVIWDTLLAAGHHELSVNFHASAKSRLESAGANSAWLSARHQGEDVHMLLAAFGGVGRAECGADWVSSCYGERSMAPVFRVVGSGVGRQDIVTVVVPSRDTAGVEVRELSARGGKAIAIVRPGTVDVVTLRYDDAVTADELTTDAEMSWVRRRGAQSPVLGLAMLNGRSLVAYGSRLDSPTVASVAARPNANRG